MELTVLGAGPAYTNRAGASGAAYLLRSDGASLLVDLGQGSFPRLAAEVEPSCLDGVLISHLHPDHFVDLVPLRHYLRYEFQPPRRVAVHADGRLTERLDGLHGQRGFTAAALDVVPLEPGGRAIGPFEVEAARVTHTDDSYAFRISTAEGASLVYSGDLGRADDLLGLCRPGDVLLVEVSFGPGPAAPGAQHLDGPAVGRLASQAQVGRLLLTHLQMGFDVDETIRSVEALYGGPVTLVEPAYRTTI